MSGWEQRLATAIALHDLALAGYLLLGGAAAMDRIEAARLGVVEVIDGAMAGHRRGARAAARRGGRRGGALGLLDRRQVEKHVREAIEAIAEDAWITLGDYPDTGEAQIAGALAHFPPGTTAPTRPGV